MSSTVRRASHAGSWYAKDGRMLHGQLEEWLQAALASNIKHAPARAIIAPHAGYAYSGPCAAFAYGQINPTAVKRIFLLGPSHHVSLDGCALTTVKQYETPLYNIPIDVETTEKLKATGKFQEMSIKMDEEEHSLEMHLPYIAKVMESRQGLYSLVPILVGQLSSKKEEEYGVMFSEYLADSSNLFIISSDFCHWGKRFSYTYANPEWGEIHESIQKLDKMGMDIIERIDAKEFRAYLKQYGNTICGRNPISVFLSTLETFRKTAANSKISLKFVQYTQSSPCRKNTDSSVSYASASLTMK
ncbi:hypothetical protein RvY_05515 [Ramazzottius varieornatus]|uniref:Protein MEMO1 n=1 Tax=Ramazzottius varieornatus TaxID=947166 RepID=A0A1D1UYU4_RAMVA|nr:hypothetical protein RvY_05515 [Ramazzottius varieornatus]